MTSHCCIINTQELGGSSDHIDIEMLLDIEMLSFRSFFIHETKYRIVFMRQL